MALVRDLSGNGYKAEATAQIAAAATNVVSRGRRILHWSDSFATQQQVLDGAGIGKGPFGMAVALEAYSRGKFRTDYANIKGVLGENSTDCYKRFAADVKARKAFFDILLIDIGRNDPANTKADGDVTVGNIILMIKAGKSIGADVWVATPHIPRGLIPNSATNQKVRGYVNKVVKQYCDDNDILYIDVWADMVDPTSTAGAFAPGLSSDTLHVNTMGGRTEAKAAIRAVDAIYPTLRRTQSVWDMNDSVYNPNGNALNLLHANAPQLFGVGGTKNNAITGNLADGYNISCYSGVATECTVQKIAAAVALDADGGDAQAFTFTATSQAWGGEFFGGFNTTADLVGKSFELEFETEVISWAGGTLPKFNAYLRPGTGGTLAQAFSYDQYALGERMLVRTAPAVFGNLNQFCQIAVGLAIATGQTGQVKIVNPYLRVLG